MAPEGNDVVVETPVVADVVEVSADAAKGTLTVEEALEIVLKKALVCDGLVRGAKESIKALDRKDVELC
ncbi:40S ribosomal protein S12, partial [Coemansia sp. 'formosensis']